MDEKTTHGPLSTESALVDLLKQVDSAVAKGAKVALGGKRIDRAGSFMQATILTDVKPDNPAFRDEFFGPVAMFFRVKDEAAAIALANDSDFGLGGSVFTKDIARGKRVASQVETGMMFINNIDWSDAELPFRWHQRFRLRARIGQYGNPGVCEQEVGSHTRYGCSFGLGPGGDVPSACRWVLFYRRLASLHRASTFTDLVEAPKEKSRKCTSMLRFYGKRSRMNVVWL